ncbi:tyrosinase family oxidase copper chaperone [Streptomyces sp. V3I7]|uniref:tyrosinase family oxidase copper chaperone n=1 Tax=Streptomyces sp. V3I7 TaxID=3042278 RepID=UPI00277FA206|nr:tyrosinase family oxidase copper chaperone [Streptomyces sp. V3I7]MDQ0990985.1 hypothetical protein [Streptomyces sp. V3I7]
MAVSVGGVPVGADRETESRETGNRETGSRVASGPHGRTRRELGRGLLASAAALALAPVVAASRPQPPAGESDRDAFEETYHGRRIQGIAIPAVGRVADGGDWHVTVDGHPLHLMRRADGTWLSMLDHYSSYRTPLEATRAAVDQLGPAQRLRDMAPGPVGAHAHMGGPHGVRA